MQMDVAGHSRHFYSVSLATKSWSVEIAITGSVLDSQFLPGTRNVASWHLVDDVHGRVVCGQSRLVSSTVTAATVVVGAVALVQLRRLRLFGDLSQMILS